MNTVLRYTSVTWVIAVGLGMTGCGQAPSSLTASSPLAPAASPAQAESIMPSLAGVSAIRQDYVTVDLDTLPSNVALVGDDPEAIALQIFSPVEPIEGFFEQTVESEQVEGVTVVTLTQTGLPDDSIRGMRYRMEFVPVNARTNAGPLQLDWVGKQYTCQPGRGNQEWSTEWCN